MFRKVRLSSLVLFFLCFGLFFLSTGCSKNEQVVVYTSVDQVFSEPILKKFEKETGIKVKAVYDVEAAKTTGLVNRLIAEKTKPQADVFWSSEFAQTMMLRDKGVLTPYVSPSAQDIPETFKDPQGYWTAFGGRARVILVNTARIAPQDYPSSIFDLLDPKYPPADLAIAYPMFGTTATQAAAIYAALGEEKAKEFYQNIKARGIQVVDGNSVVKDMVADGRIMWGLTDTDDAREALEKGAPVAVIYPDQKDLGTLVIPNTVAMIKGAPHPQEAKKVIDYLLSRQVERELVETGFIQAPCRPLGIKIEGIPKEGIRSMNVSFADIYRQFANSKKDMEAIFVR